MGWGSEQTTRTGTDRRTLMRACTWKNQKNQQAIMRLLDEMSSLADGDLTVRATVTDDMTGAIADSVNFAVEQLRELVTGINKTALTVSESAQETMDTMAAEFDQILRETGFITE